MATISGYRWPGLYPTGFTSTPPTIFPSFDFQVTSSASPNASAETCGLASVSRVHFDRSATSATLDTVKWELGVFGSAYVMRIRFELSSRLTVSDAFSAVIWVTLPDPTSIDSSWFVALTP